MKRIAQIIFLALTLAGCSVKYLPVVSHDTVHVFNEVVRDSIVILPPDSSVIEAWFECDSLNHVIMIELETHAGEKVKPYTKFNKGQFTVAAKIDSQSVYLSWKERHDSTTITETKIKEVEVPKVVYKKPRWLKIMAGLGAGSIILLIFSFINKFKIK